MNRYHLRVNIGVTTEKIITLYLSAEMFFFVKKIMQDIRFYPIIHQELQVFVCNPIPPTSCISRELTEQNRVKLQKNSVSILTEVNWTDCLCGVMIVFVYTNNVTQAIFPWKLNFLLFSYFFLSWNLFLPGFTSSNMKIASNPAT